LIFGEECFPFHSADGADQKLIGQKILAKTKCAKLLRNTFGQIGVARYYGPILKPAGDWSKIWGWSKYWTGQNKRPAGRDFEEEEQVEILKENSAKPDRIICRNWTIWAMWRNHFQWPKTKNTGQILMAFKGQIFDCKFKICRSKIDVQNPSVKIGPPKSGFQKLTLKIRPSKNWPSKSGRQNLTFKMAGLFFETQISMVKFWRLVF